MKCSYGRFVLITEDIEHLSDEELNQLNCGDAILKVTGSDTHKYKVSYKGLTGICLTYSDASCVETISYDLVEGHWQFNSKDVTPLGGAGGTKLYKHSIKSGNNFEIVSTRSETYSTASISNIANDWIKGASAGFMITSIVFDTKLDELTITYLVTGGSILTQTFSISSITSDTVTEL